jgi:hypothetical protein
VFAARMQIGGAEFTRGHLLLILSWSWGLVVTPVWRLSAEDRLGRGTDDA